MTDLFKQFKEAITLIGWSLLYVNSKVHILKDSKGYTTNYILRQHNKDKVFRLYIIDSLMSINHHNAIACFEIDEINILSNGNIRIGQDKCYLLLKK